MAYPSRQIQIQTLFVKLVNLSKQYFNLFAASCFLLPLTGLLDVAINFLLDSGIGQSSSHFLQSRLSIWKVHWPGPASPYKISSWSWSFISEQRKFAMFTIRPASYLLTLGVWASASQQIFIVFIQLWHTLTIWASYTRQRFLLIYTWRPCLL